MLPLRFRIVDNRPPVGGAAGAAAAAAQAKARSKGGKDDEEEQTQGRGGKPSGGRKPAPPGRGPYKVSIMLTGGRGGAGVGVYAGG